MTLRFTVCLLELWSRGVIVIRNSFLAALLKFFFFVQQQQFIWKPQGLLKQWYCCGSLDWQILPDWGWPKNAT